MSNGNGKAEAVRVKQCPFLKEYCIKERCALWVEMRRQTGELKQSFGMCSFNSMVMILSEISQKTQPPQQKINIPNLVRG